MRTEGTGTDMTYHSKNRQGELLLNMVGKKENTAFMQLFCPLQSINTLIPPGEHRKNKIRLDNNASDLSVYLSSIYCYLSSIIEFELFWLSPPLDQELMLEYDWISPQINDSLWQKLQQLNQNCMSKKFDCMSWLVCWNRNRWWRFINVWRPAV